MPDSAPVTIYDLAREAGVSAATVSRALNHPELVSRPTRERVLAAAQRQGYWARGRQNARQVTGVTVIGAVGPFSSLSSAQRHLSGILERARGLPVEVVALDHERVRLTAKAVGRLPIAGRVDGLVLVDLPATPSAIMALRTHDLPTVLLGTDHPELPSVSIDHRAGTLAVVDLLEDLRAASLLLVGLDGEAAAGRHFLASDAPSSEGASRLAPVLGELRARGIAVRPDALIVGGDSIADTARALGAALAGRTLPVSVFAVTDELATAVVRAAAQLGLVIPRDVFVIGYGDTAVAEALSITSIREPLAEAGGRALDLAVARTYGQDVPARSRLAPLVIARSTTPAVVAES